MNSVPRRVNKMHYHMKFVSEFARQYFKIFNLRANSRILNIGMGSEHPLTEIEPFFPRYYKEILCVDKFAKIVNYLNSTEKDSRVRALQMDIETTKLPVTLRDRFDFVCSSDSLMYLSDIRQAFSNVTQLLRKNGELFFIWPKRGDVHDLYKAMSRMQRWEPYMSDFRNWQNYFDNENPTITLNRELKLVGIEVLKSELVNLLFEEQDKMKFFAFPEMVYSTTVANEHVPKETIYFTQCAPSWENETDTYFTIARMIFSYTFPLLFMSIAYIQIIRVLWRSGQISHQVVDVAGRQSNSFAMNMNASTEGQLKSRKKAAKMLVAVVIMFAICYFPVHLFSLLRLTVGLKNSETNRALAMISHWLCYANSAVNPIIYNFMSGKYRKEFRRAFENGCYWGTDKNGRQSSAFYRKTHRTTRTSGTRCHYDDSSQKDAAIKLNY